LTELSRAHVNIRGAGIANGGSVASIADSSSTDNDFIGAVIGFGLGCFADKDAVRWIRQTNRAACDKLSGTVTIGCVAAAPGVSIEGMVTIGCVGAARSVSVKGTGTTGCVVGARGCTWK
jgi:hypothetical protein